MSRSMPQPRYSQAQVQPTTTSLHSLLSSQPGVSFNPNKPAFIPSPSGPHGNIAAAHLQSLAASHAQAQAQAAQAAQLQAQAQAALHMNLQSLNAKIVQAQQLALINGMSVDEVLRRMGGLSEAEVGLLKLCVVREQEERLKVQAVGLMSQQQQVPFQPQTQTRAPLRTTSPPNITLNPPPPTYTSTSAQEQRAAARLKVEQNLRARCGKEQPQAQQQSVVQSSGGWEEAFAKMNIGLGAGQRFTQGVGQGMVMTPPQGRVDLPPVAATRTTQSQVSSPVVRSFSPANSAHSASSDSVKKDVLPTPGTVQDKHVQAVSWRAVGKLQQAPVSPAASPLSVKLTAQNAENAVKSFNGVFGNKVVTPAQATFGGNAHTHAPSSPARLTRSGSGSSGSGHSSAGDEASVASSSPSLSGGRRRRSSGSCDTGMTTPVSEGESGDKANYFGSKNLQVHGRDESYPLCKVSSKGSNASVANSNASFAIGAGVIGQGYPGVHKVPVVQFSAVIRQPHGPPGGADELGNKNFASRIRQKAVSDLSVLGRRVAQRSPTVPSY